MAQPLFTDYTDSELKSVQDALQHALQHARKGRLTHMGPRYLQSLRMVKIVMEERKMRLCAR